MDSQTVKVRTIKSCSVCDEIISDKITDKPTTWLNDLTGDGRITYDEYGEDSKFTHYKDGGLCFNCSQQVIG